MNGRATRGLEILRRGGQIRHIGDGSYTIKSQTIPNELYTLTRDGRGWNCSCPDDAIYCKHAWALEWKLENKARADRGKIIYCSRDLISY